MVYLVGAGPGDAGLITVRGAQLLRTADVVVFDALANRDLLDLAPPHARRIDAGKRAGRHKLSQDQINATLAEHAAAGRRVVRLKGGDPYVFGRGSEEAMYLHARGIGVEVVPGITAAIAGPAAMGVPVTHRHVAATCTFITGHEDPTKPDTQVDYPALAALAQRGGTLCFYMAVGRLGRVVQTLIDHGCDAATPAAVVQWGTLATQRSLRSTLADLPAAVERAGLGAPAIVVVGPVAGLDEAALNWFEHRPLFGRTIAITRTRRQSSTLRAALESLGARVIEAPTIDIAPPADIAPLDRALAEIDRYDWLVLSSANGVAALAASLDRSGADARRLAPVRIAVVGDATAAALRDRLGITADLAPRRAIAEALADALVADGVAGRRVLLWQGQLARPLLRDRLTRAGAEVTAIEAYRTLRVDALPDELLEALRDGMVDCLAFTSSSTVRHFVELLPDRALADRPALASIGPITSTAARDAGLTVDIQADEHDVPGLVAALIEALKPAKSSGST